MREDDLNVFSPQLDGVALNEPPRTPKGLCWTCWCFHSKPEDCQDSINSIKQKTSLNRRKRCVFLCPNILEKSLLLWVDLLFSNEMGILRERQLRRMERHRSLYVAVAALNAASATAVAWGIMFLGCPPVPFQECLEGINIWHKCSERID